MIEEYHFGSITILGRNYTHDVEVRWTGDVLDWWRGKSHLINAEDVKRAIEQNPDLIVIGTGESGIAKVTERAKEEILSKGIGLIVDKTEEAVKTFNIQKERAEEEDGKQKKVIGLFHCIGSDTYDTPVKFVIR